MKRYYALLVVALAGMVLLIAVAARAQEPELKLTLHDQANVTWSQAALIKMPRVHWVGPDWDLSIRDDGTLDVFGSTESAKRDFWLAVFPGMMSLCHEEDVPALGTLFLSARTAQVAGGFPDNEWRVTFSAVGMEIEGDVPVASKEFWEYQQHELERRCRAGAEQ